MRSFATLLMLLAGCSFVAVRGAVRVPDDGRPFDRAKVKCTTSQVAPTLDALAGAAAIAAAGGGIFVEHLSDTGKLEHFTLYYAAPLTALGVLYFYAASYGTRRVSRCLDLKEGVGGTEPVRPIEFPDLEAK